MCFRRALLRLTTDVIAWTYKKVPKWNPMNVCSYHLQEAGATPVQELAFALATAIAVLDTVRARDYSGGGFPQSGGADFVLRQRRHPVRHRDVQDARLRRSLG
jgi:predicted MarR family transcription regulator